MTQDTLLLDALTEMTAASLKRVDMAARELMMVRLAALAAMDAPPASYLLNLGAAAEAGLSVEDVQAVLVAVAPVIGTPRAVAAAAAVTEALGMALAIDDAIEAGDF